MLVHVDGLGLVEGRNFLVLVMWSSSGLMVSDKMPTGHILSCDKCVVAEVQVLRSAVSDQEL